MSITGVVRFINKLKGIAREYSNKIRPEIMKRDGNKCQICSSLNNLEMHHIISVDDYIDFLYKNLNKDNVIASEWIMKDDSEKIINHPSNLIILCKDCHDSLTAKDFIKLKQLAIKNTELLPKQLSLTDFSQITNWILLIILDLISMAN